LSRRGKIIGGVLLVVLLAVIIALAVVAWVDQHYPGALSWPSSERQSFVISTLTDQLGDAYGPTLDTVDVRYGRADHVPTYFVAFRLKDVPFTYRFSVDDESIAPYYDNRSYDTLVHPELLGGPIRVVDLAQAYHRDFPAARSMGFKRTYPGNLPAPLPQVVGEMRPAVLVADGEPFQSELSRVTAVYVWDAGAHEWKLIHRGPLSEPGT
jgi:hypothetical protein